MGKHLPKKITSNLKYFLSALAKPQIKHFLVYLIGLIWLIKFHSTREIASQVAKTLPDNLQRFLNGSVKKQKRLQETSQKLLARMANKQPEVFAVIDDTTCAREGKKIEGLGIHHSSDGLATGQCAVTCVLKIAGEWLAWSVRGYRPKLSCPKGEFRSKIDLAKEILQDIRQKIHTSVMVLMDSWYTCAPILIPIIEAGWTFVAAIKCNRILEIGGKKTVVRHLAFGHVFMRSWQGVQTHWTLVMIAYNLVILSAPKHLKGFRQKIRHFRNTITYQDLLRLSNVSAQRSK